MEKLKNIYWAVVAYLFTASSVFAQADLFSGSKQKELIKVVIGIAVVFAVVKIIEDVKEGDYKGVLLKGVGAIALVGLAVNWDWFISTISI